MRLFTEGDRNGPWIDTRPLVIDLSARKVAELARLSARPPSAPAHVLTPSSLLRILSAQGVTSHA